MQVHTVINFPQISTTDFYLLPRNAISHPHYTNLRKLHSKCINQLQNVYNQGQQRQCPWECQHLSDSVRHTSLRLQNITVA